MDVLARPDPDGMVIDTKDNSSSSFRLGKLIFPQNRLFAAGIRCLLAKTVTA